MVEAPTLRVRDTYGIILMIPLLVLLFILSFLYVLLWFPYIDKDHK